MEEAVPIGKTQTNARMSSAFMMFCQNKGYTFTEVVLSLTILTIITALLSPILPYIKGGDTYSDGFAVEQFVDVLYEEASQSKAYTFSRDVLVVKDKDDRTIEISKNDSSVKRTVNGRGYEILLQQVKYLSFTEQDYTVSVKVGLKNGASFEKILHIPYNQ